MDVQRRENEDSFEWELRLCLAKINKEIDLDWQEIVDLLGLNIHYDSLRKLSYGYKKMSEHLKNNGIDSKLAEIDMKIVELQKEKVKTRDQRTEFNRLIRESARHEVIMDEINNVVQIMAKEKSFIHTTPSTRTTNKSAVLQLSDWHYSLFVDCFLNKYDLDIFKQRINKLVATTIEYGMLHNIESLYVLLQGDFISSSIHESLRVSNQEDVISQIMNTSEVLGEIINELSSYFRIKVAIVEDNHSRVVADKKKSIDKENYMRITKWYLESRLANHEYVEFIDSTHDMDISVFKIYDYNCAMVHGHKDRFSTITSKLSPYTRDVYDFIFTAHNHHLQCEEQNMAFVIGNGSLIGVDSYSSSLRLSSQPSQNFIVINKETGLEAICPIKL